jgi:hypothetical protein
MPQPMPTKQVDQLHHASIVDEYYRQTLDKVIKKLKILDNKKKVIMLYFCE